MNSLRITSVIVLCAGLLLACGTPALFPKEAVEGVDKHFDFNAWRTSPSSSIGRKVQLGGRILDGQAIDQGTLIVGRQLPVVEHPAYGPTDSLRKLGAGAFEFAFSYPGKIEPSALTAGNRFIVVGTTQGAKSITVDGATRNAPFLTARCVHIWKTSGKEIAEFEYSAAGYQPLEQATYCAP